MELAGYEILKEIVKRREVTLGDVCSMIDKKYGDHRDFYGLASLYTSGHIDSSIKKSGCSWDTSKNMLVAEELFLLSLGKGTFDVENIPQFTNEEDYLQTFKFFCTAKSDLYFHELRHKRLYLVGTLCVGIIVGILSAFLGAYFTAQLVK